MRSIVVAAFAAVLSVSCAPEPSSSAGPTGPGPAPVEQSGERLTQARPIVGGHVLVSSDKAFIVVADVDRDRIRIFDMSSKAHRRDVALPAGSWPTRIIELTPVDYQVLLRGTGELATIHLGANASTVETKAVCPEPRGLTHDSTTGETVVACAGGELVHLRAAELTTEQTAFEWRDVAFGPRGALVGTTFRSANLVQGGIAQLLSSQKVTDFSSPAMHVPQVAWRMLRSANDTFIVHQLHADELRVESQPMDPMNPGPAIPPSQPGSSPYGGGSTGGTPINPCRSGAVVTGISRLTDSGLSFSAHTNDVLPVDAALSPDGTMLAVAGAGGSGLSIYPVALLQGGNGCLTPISGVGGLPVTSVAWVSNTQLAFVEALHSNPVLFDLSSGMATAIGNETALSSPSFSLFHLAPRGGAALACASCHPEGGEDGHTWNIDSKLRRTQTLAGGVMARAPFHWNGNLPSLSSLMDDTFVKRMGATALQASEVAALGVWLNTIPMPRSSRTLDTAGVAAGVAAFTKAGCISCHLDAGKTEGPLEDIGTGEAVRSPNLSGVSARAPYLHTGEIATLRDRVFGSLHPSHGSINVLDSTEKDALLAYLECL